MNLRDLHETYMRLHARLHCSSWVNMERIFEVYLSHWADRPVNSIKKIEVRELHASLGTTPGKRPGGRKTTANRVVQHLATIYNWGFDNEIIDCRNPAKRIRLYSLKPRERFMDVEEVDRFMKAVATLRYQTTRDFLIMCLLTAARRSNVAAMRWEDISFELEHWYIAETKNGSSQYVPLVAEALAILKRRREETKGSPWVFPSTRSKSGHLTKPENAWKMVVQRSGLENIRVHDLRRTLASWQAITGTDTPILAQTLNHKDFKSTKIYARLNIDPVRTSMARALQKIAPRRTA